MTSKTGAQKARQPPHCSLEHLLVEPSGAMRPPYCEEAQASPCGGTTWRSAESMKGVGEREGERKGEE